MLRLVGIKRFCFYVRQEEKEELLAKASEEPEETPNDKIERLKAQMDQERLERKSKLNAYKVSYS